MYDIAVGDLGLRREEFERMTWGEFQCRYMGWIRKREADLYTMRGIMWAALKPHAKKGFKPENLFELPSDKKAGKDFERISVDEYRKLRDG